MVAINKDIYIYAVKFTLETMFPKQNFTVDILHDDARFDDYLRIGVMVGEKKFYLTQNIHESIIRGEAPPNLDQTLITQLMLLVG